MTGIVSYGFYVPQSRIAVADIARVWDKSEGAIERSLGVTQKAVAAVDEDALTMAYEAAQQAVLKAGQGVEDIGVAFVGSETHPYSVNPTSTILGEFLGLPNEYLAFDTEFACKAATGAMMAATGLVQSGFTKRALICAADKATGKPHDALEYTAASAAVAVILGDEKVAVEIVDMLSYSSDTPDFWRREGIRYPSHGGRFTGKPSYFRHVYSASSALLERTKLAPKDFAHAVFHMPNGKFPKQVAESLGFENAQIEQSLVVSELGNSYTASALMGLVSVLSVAKAGDKIFFCSYGSGAGSDAYVFQVTPELARVRVNFDLKTLPQQHISYPQYLKQMGMIG